MKNARSIICQLIIDMQVMEKREIKRRDMIELIKEVNDSKMIGHACRFVINSDQIITHIQKYRKTAIEKQIEREKIDEIKRNGFKA